MSREIKFRAWDKKNKKIVKVLKICWGSNGKILELLVEDFDTNHAYLLKPSEAVIEQDTGLKDKNGKEIYEGNLLKIGNSIEEVKFSEMKDSDYSYFYLGWAVGESSLYEWASLGEIVGNIHENPELLDGVKEPK